MNKQTEKTQFISKRKKVFGLMLLVAAVIATLLYFEQVAVIYVLSTLSLVILLLIVAFADLEKVGLSDEAETATEPTTVSEENVQINTARNYEKTAQKQSFG
ncbi:MAG TPA: hypothetical protein PKY59_26600 [Pyrinomonadaceae bacterium]|nr:hypothetical protein [Pyrinomonadaceae bacterium]